MALTVSLTLPATTALVDGVVVEVPEITYPQAYARAYAIRAFAQESYILVTWYADEAARFANADPVKAYEYNTSTASLVGDIYPAAYAFLKTLPDFAGAIDHPFVDPAEVVEPVVEVVEPEPVEPEPAPEPNVPAADA